MNVLETLLFKVQRNIGIILRLSLYLCLPLSFLYVVGLLWVLVT